MTMVAKNGVHRNGNGKAKTKAPLASKRIDAAALLQSAVKKESTKRGGPFEYDGNLQAVAGKILSLGRQRDEIERELALAKDECRRALDPWYQERLRTNGHEPSVTVPSAGALALRVTYQHRYLKLATDRADAIQGIVGDAAYAAYFRQGATLKVRKEIADDPEKLADVVTALAEAIGVERFKEWFEAETTVLPTKVFTERRYVDLDENTNERLTLAGVRQVVAFAAHRTRPASASW